MLAVYRDLYPGISAGWVSVAGLEPGIFKPVTSLPEVLQACVDKLERKGARELAVQGLEVVRPLGHVYFRNTVPLAKQALVVRLIGYDEYYGVLVLCSGVEGYFSGRTLSEIDESRQLLNRLMAEAN